MALISVIVPVYKVEQYIHRCVDSILNQTFTDYDLILVDDGSPDNCGNICEGYAVKDKRIIVIHQENGGLAEARNTGISWAFANSDSLWLCFIDSDDWVHPRYLEYLYKANVKNETKISQCQYCTTDGTVIPVSETEKTLLVTTEEAYTNWYSAFAWGKLYSKDVFEEIRYPVDILYEDVTIWYKILFSQEYITIVDEPLYYYFQRSDSIVNSDWTPRNLARIKAWDDQLLFFDKYGNDDLLNTTAKYYCQIASQEYESIKKSNRLSEREKKQYKSFISKKLRKVVLRFHKAIKTSDQYKWYLEIAFPNYSVCHWGIRRIGNRFKNILNSKRR